MSQWKGSPALGTSGGYDADSFRGTGIWVAYLISGHAVNPSMGLGLDIHVSDGPEIRYATQIPVANDLSVVMRALVIGSPESAEESGWTLTLGTVSNRDVAPEPPWTDSRRVPRVSDHPGYP